MQTIRRYSILLILVLSFVSLFSQNTNDSLRHIMVTNTNHYIKWSFLNLLEPEPSFQLGYSFPLLKGKMHLMTELGYVFSPSLAWKQTSGNWDDNIKESGIRTRVNIRKYYPTANSKPNKKHYFALDVMYKYAQVYEQGVYVSRFGGEYREIMNVGTQKSVFAFHVLYGSEKSFVYQSKIMLDYFFGIGYKYKYVKNIELPKDVNNGVGSSYWWYDEIGSMNTICIMLGVKLGFGW